jgi:hypothetical protein
VKYADLPTFAGIIKKWSNPLNFKPFGLLVKIDNKWTSGAYKKFENEYFCFELTIKS